MKKDLKSSIVTIAAFLGKTISSEVVTKIADLTSFGKMKDDNFLGDIRWSKFMRKGIVGDWKNHLSADQSAQIDALCSKKLKIVGLEFDYE